jgi:hypothetical protein
MPGATACRRPLALALPATAAVAVVAWRADARPRLAADWAGWAVLAGMALVTADCGRPFSPAASKRPGIPGWSTAAPVRPARRALALAGEIPERRDMHPASGRRHAAGCRHRPADALADRRRPGGSRAGTDLPEAARRHAAHPARRRCRLRTDGHRPVRRPRGLVRCRVGDHPALRIPSSLRARTTRSRTPVPDLPTVAAAIGERWPFPC